MKAAVLCLVLAVALCNAHQTAMQLQQQLKTRTAETLHKSADVHYPHAMHSSAKSNAHAAYDSAYGNDFKPSFASNHLSESHADPVDPILAEMLASTESQRAAIQTEQHAALKVKSSASLSEALTSSTRLSALVMAEQQLQHQLDAAQSMAQKVQDKLKQSLHVPGIPKSPVQNKTDPFPDLEINMLRYGSTNELVTQIVGLPAYMLTYIADKAKSTGRILPKYPGGEERDTIEIKGDHLNTIQQAIDEWKRNPQPNPTNGAVRTDV